MNHWEKVVQSCIQNEINEDADHPLKRRIRKLDIRRNIHGVPVLSVCYNDVPNVTIHNELYIVGFSGKAGSGKDTARGFLHNHLAEKNLKHSITNISFADSLKEIASILCNCDINYFHDQELKQTNHLVFDMTYRKIAQVIGTECFRDVFGEDVWVITVLQKFIHGLISMDRAIALTTGSKEGPPFSRTVDLVIPQFLLIADARFENEADMIRSLGGTVIRINRENHSNSAEVDSHRSEQLFEVKDVDMVIENVGTLDDFKKACEHAFDVLDHTDFEHIFYPS